MLDEEIDQLLAELRQSLDKNEDDRIDVSEVGCLQNQAYITIGIINNLKVFEIHLARISFIIQN